MIEYGKWRNYTVGAKKLLRRKPVPVALHLPPQFSRGLALDDSPASAVRGQRLDARDIARPYKEIQKVIKY